MVDYAYYYVLNNEARKRTVEAINKRLLRTGDINRWDKLTLCSIGGTEKGDAFGFARSRWPQYYGEDTHLGFPESWEKLYFRYFPGKDHFELAIWQEVDDEQVLVALALGNPSNAHTHLTVKWVERYFGHSYLAGRALWPILTCAEEYAKLLGCERVLILNPVDPSKYERYGYSPYFHPDVAYGGYYFGKELK